MNYRVEFRAQSSGSAVRWSADFLGGLRNRGAAGENVFSILKIGKFECRKEALKMLIIIASNRIGEIISVSRVPTGFSTKYRTPFIREISNSENIQLHDTGNTE